MFYVYIIRSIDHPEHVYVGYTKNLKKRFSCHNSGGSVHTAKYRPWEIVVYFGFKSDASALRFEKYLKTQSGRAFLRKRFIEN